MGLVSLDSPTRALNKRTAKEFVCEDVKSGGVCFWMNSLTRYELL